MKLNPQAKIKAMRGQVEIARGINNHEAEHGNGGDTVTYRLILALSHSADLVEHQQDYIQALETRLHALEVFTGMRAPEPLPVEPETMRYYQNTDSGKVIARVNGIDPRPPWLEIDQDEYERLSQPLTPVPRRLGADAGSQLHPASLARARGGQGEYHE